MAEEAEKQDAVNADEEVVVKQEKKEVASVEASPEPAPVKAEASEDAAAGDAKKEAGEAKKEAGDAKKDVSDAKPEASGEGRPAEASTGEEEPKRERVRGHRVSSVGIAHVKATFNNTLVSITDMSGAVIAWSNAGRAGFKSSRKSTAFAATAVGQDAARQAAAKGMREVEVQVQGSGSGRESAVRALQSAGLNISIIKDVTPMPHNGCRARKRRRV